LKSVFERSCFDGPRSNPYDLPHAARAWLWGVFCARGDRLREGQRDRRLRRELRGRSGPGDVDRQQDDLDVDAELHVDLDAELHVDLDAELHVDLDSELDVHDVDAELDDDEQLDGYCL
jgi:hypothetical protein